MSSSPVAVFCGSSIGKHQAFTAAAVCEQPSIIFSYSNHIHIPFLNLFTTFVPALGRALASAKRPLVYGGGWSGIMGVISSTVLEEGEKVVGIIPNSMFTGSEDVGKKGVRGSFYLVHLRVYSTY